MADDRDQHARAANDHMAVAKDAAERGDLAALLDALTASQDIAERALAAKGVIID